jgi:hypothetical protein
MEAVPKPVTEALVVQVPDIEVLAVKVDSDAIEIRSRKAPRGGPFGREIIAALLGQNSELADLFKRYNYVTRHLPSSALDEFLEMRRPQDGAAFVHKYGPFIDWGTGGSGLFGLGGETPASQISFNVLRQQREQLSAILWLDKALVDRNQADIDEALQDAYNAGLNIASDHSKAIAFHLTKHLARSMPALLPTQDGLQSALMCPDVMTGLYGLLLSAIAEKRPWKMCEQCRELFRTAHTAMRFCSASCQNIAKQRRHRQRQKESMVQTKKGSKNGRKRSKER